MPSEPAPAESLQARSERIAETVFLGGPAQDFERVGRLVFEVMLREGLAPSSRVLDVGCGALRVGYWLMRFLDGGCYHGIEPNREMLNVGLEQIVEPDVVERARASFTYNDDFDLRKAGSGFDFVLARSIWTHASKPQIAAMLESFARVAAPRGVLLATYHPASRLYGAGVRWPALEQMLPSLPIGAASALLAGLPSFGLGEEYEGGEWVGRSHRSDIGGVVRHSLRWIGGEAARHGLRAEIAAYPIINHQYWLRVTRAGAGSGQ